MVKCKHCGFENPDDEFLCVLCSMPLRMEDAEASPEPKNGATRVLDNPREASNFPRWGTARLGMERKLLFHVRGHDKPLVVNLSDQLVLGRYDTDTGDTPDIDLQAYGAQDLGVSRRHATILIEDDTLKVIDLGSANATFINGQKLIAHQARILRDGDELRLGRLVIRVNFA